MRAWIEIDLNAIRANAAALRDWVASGVQVMAVVKADAYGHGLLPVAKASIEAGIEWLGVAAVSEGVALREAGITQSICLLCPFDPADAATIVAHRLTPAVGDMATLEALSAAAKRSPASSASGAGTNFAIHLDIDTGMGRSGVQPSQAVALWQKAAQLSLNVSGIATHFADADNADETLTCEQEAAYAVVMEELRLAGATFDWNHVANSPATLRGYGKSGNLVRPGLLLYGIAPFPQTSPVAITTRPALTLKARIAAVRDLPQGHAISYGATCRLARPSRVATVLIGYGDGYPRRLSNSGFMLVRGQRVPILGRVCMDQTVVDVTDIPEAAPGDEAVCIGAQGDERISVEELAAQIDTTQHEITTCLTARLPRIYSSAS